MTTLAVQQPRTSSADRLARQRFDAIAARSRLDEATRTLLRMPLRELHVQIPSGTDDKRVGVYRGVRVQHDDAPGPFTGGVRYRRTAASTT